RTDAKDSPRPECIFVPAPPDLTLSLKPAPKSPRRWTFPVLRWLDRLNARFWRMLARAAGENGPARGAGARLARAARVLVLAALSFNVNEVPVRASALVFTTLLAFIPLAVLVSSA